MPTVLFVCTANRYRSPIAAACFEAELQQREADKDWTTLSAGTWTVDGLPPLPEAIQKADELGLDIRDHRSRLITSAMIKQADLVLVMDRGQLEALQNEFHSFKSKIFLLSEASRGIQDEIPDPVQHPGEREVATDICSLIRIGFERLCDQAIQ